MLRLRHLLLVAVTFLVSCQPSSDESMGYVPRDINLASTGTTIEALVPQNATFETLLRQQQLPADMTASVVDAIRGVFNPRDLRAEQSYSVTRTLDGLFREFRYQIDPNRLLRVVFRDRSGDAAASFNAEVVDLPKEYRLDAVSATITRENNSLYGAFEATGENQLLPYQLSEVFAGDVDFNSDLQLGDRVEVLFERAVRDGEFVGYGEIQAAMLASGGHVRSAYRFMGPDGKPGWYDDKGRSLRRAFLRSPLPFDPRVTSGFSTNRFHPVLGINRPHLGVDFGAPEGTRVFAVAEGLVEVAGWSGEAGRMVRVRHAGGYETSYLHLSGFAAGVRPGARVEQGQVVGYVGMTGTATGPHLDYRVAKNGVFMNPVTAFSRLQAGEPLSTAALADFARVRDMAITELQTRLVSSVAPAKPVTASATPASPSH
ncbi:MAG: M23 family metallopeptidase [Acidobacteriota bacterium]